MPTFVLVVFAAMGVFLLISASLAMIFRKRVGANAIAAGVTGRFSMTPSVVGVGLGLLQFFVALGSFALAVAIPRRMEESRFDAVLAHVAEMISPWGGVVASVALIVGVSSGAAGLILLRKCWTSRGAWVSGSGISELPPRARALLYGGGTLLVTGSIVVASALILLFTILIP